MHRFCTRRVFNHYYLPNSLLRSTPYYGSKIYTRNFGDKQQLHDEDESSNTTKNPSVIKSVVYQALSNAAVQYFQNRQRKKSLLQHEKQATTKLAKKLKELIVNDSISDELKLSNVSRFRDRIAVVAPKSKVDNVIDDLNNDIPIDVKKRIQRLVKNTPEMDYVSERNSYCNADSDNRAHAYQFMISTRNVGPDEVSIKLCVVGMSCQLSMGSLVESVPITRDIIEWEEVTTAAGWIRRAKTRKIPKKIQITTHETIVKPIDVTQKQFEEMVELQFYKELRGFRSSLSP